MSGEGEESELGHMISCNRMVSQCTFLKGDLVCLPNFPIVSASFAVGKF